MNNMFIINMAGTILSYITIFLLLKDCYYIKKLIYIKEVNNNNGNSDSNVKKIIKEIYFRIYLYIVIILFLYVIINIFRNFV